LATKLMQNNCSLTVLWFYKGGWRL